MEGRERTSLQRSPGWLRMFLCLSTSEGSWQLSLYLCMVHPVRESNTSAYLLNHFTKPVPICMLDKMQMYTIDEFGFLY